MKEAAVRNQPADDRERSAQRPLMSAVGDGLHGFLHFPDSWIACMLPFYMFVCQNMNAERWCGNWCED